MNLIKFFALLTILLLIFAMPVYSQSQEAQNALIWLSTSQNDTGSWYTSQTSLTTEYFTTVTVLDTYKSLGITDTPSFQNGIQWVNAVSIESTPYISHKITTLSNAGITNTTDVDTLIAYKNTDGGWGLQIGDDSCVYMTAKL